MLRNLLARLGLLAMGAIYAAVGVVAARIAFLGARDRVAGMSGALRFLLRQTHGQIVLRLVVAGVASYALWHVAEAAYAKKKGAIARVGHAVAALGYAALAWTGIRLLLRLRGGAPTRRGLEWLLSESWGSAALTLAGGIVMGGAASQFYQAWSGRLRERFLGGRARRSRGGVAMAIARFGLASRGAVFGIVGWFMIRAARESDPSQFREIGGALRVLSGTAAGPWLMGVTAIGLVAYALYLWTLASLRKT